MSILLRLLLASIRILSYFFFFFLVIFDISFTIPVVKEKIKVKLALAIPTGAAIILVHEISNTAPFVALKTIKILSIYSKVVTYLFNF